MKSVFQCFSRTFLKFLYLFPTPLPGGMTEFDAWASSIINTYDLPGSERDKKYVLASAIIRFGETTAYKSRYYFVLALRAAAAKQIAGAKFKEVRDALMAEHNAAEAAAKQAVVTGTTANEAAPVNVTPA